MKPTGPTNPVLRHLIKDLRSLGHEKKSNFMIDLAERLSRSERQRPAVNLGHLNRVVKNGETVVIPGNLLATGELKHKLTIYAWKVSPSAAAKVEKSGSKLHQLRELIEKNPTGKDVRIIA